MHVNLAVGSIDEFCWNTQKLLRLLTFGLPCVDCVAASQLNTHMRLSKSPGSFKWLSKKVTGTIGCFVACYSGNHQKIISIQPWNGDDSASLYVSALHMRCPLKEISEHLWCGIVESIYHGYSWILLFVRNSEIANWEVGRLGDALGCTPSVVLLHTVGLTSCILLVWVSETWQNTSGPSTQLHPCVFWRRDFLSTKTTADAQWLGHDGVTNLMGRTLDIYTYI